MKKHLLLCCLLLSTALVIKAQIKIAVGPNMSYGGYMFTFPTLKAASVFVNTNPNTTGSPIWIEFQASYTGDATTNSTIQFDAVSNVNGIFIAPAAGVGPVTTAFNPGDNNPMILINGITKGTGNQFITLDGREGQVGSTSAWTIENTHAANLSGPVIKFAGGAQDNVLKYLQVKGNTNDFITGLIHFGDPGSTLGNSFNKIEYNVFNKGSGLMTTVMSSVSLAGPMQTALKNAGNIIQYNQFTNFTAFGINITANTGNGDGWQIHDNSFYATMPIVTTYRYTAISISKGDNHKIYNNSIGGASADRQGTPLQVTSDAAPSVCAIEIASNESTALTEVHDNKIGNIEATNTNESDAFVGVWVRMAAANVYFNQLTPNNAWDKLDVTGSAYGIVYSGTSTGSLILLNTIIRMQTIGAFNSSLYGIYIFGGGDYNIWKNTITAITATQTTNTDPGAACVGLGISGPGNYTIDENTITNMRNISPSFAAPISVIAVAAGNTIIRKNYVYGNFTNNGQDGVAAGYSFGLYQIGGVVNMYNNFMTLGQNLVENVYGIYLGNNTAGNKYVYNSIYIGGTTTGNTPSSVFERDNSTEPDLTIENNIFYNNRTSSSQGNFAIVNVGNSGWANNCNHNFYVTTDAAKVGYFGGLNQDFANWNSVAAENYSYAATTAEVPANTFFINPSIAVLTVNTASPLAWYVNGKANPLLSYNQDFYNTSRSGIVATGATDIGAYEFTPSVPPPDAAVTSGTLAVGAPQVFSFAGQKVAQIDWHGTNLPSSVNLKYFTGTAPSPAVPPSGGPGTQKVLNSYWKIDATGGTAGAGGYNYDLTLFFDPVCQGTITSINTADMIKKPATNGWEDRSTQRSFSAGSNSFKILNELTGFSAFTAAEVNTVLLVKLESFTAQKLDNDVALSWKTAGEAGNKEFQLERSFDANHFEKIATISSLNENVHYYQFTDQSALTKFSGKLYYRLKMVENNGLSSYSAVVVVDNSSAKIATVQVTSQNPFTDHIDVLLNYNHAGKLSITLSSLDGKPVSTRDLMLPAGSSIVRLQDLQKLSSGSYILNIITPSGKTDKKMLKLK